MSMIRNQVLWWVSKARTHTQFYQVGWWILSLWIKESQQTNKSYNERGGGGKGKKKDVQADEYTKTIYIWSPWRGMALAAALWNENKTRSCLFKKWQEWEDQLALLAEHARGGHRSFYFSRSTMHLLFSHVHFFAFDDFIYSGQAIHVPFQWIPSCLLFWGLHLPSNPKLFWPII